MLSRCEELGLSAAFSTTRDISGSGTCSSYWLYKNNKWQRVNKFCYSKLIFDKFFPRDSLRKFQRKKLFSSPNVKSFTSRSLLEMFFDKFQTYSSLGEYSVPTVKVNGKSVKSVENSIVKLREIMLRHTNNKDFGNNIIMKDRYGAGGKNIYSISSNFAYEIYDVMKNNKTISFILQPHVAFEAGYQYQDFKGATEIRLIYKGKDVVQTYVRIAKSNDFICNNGGGGIWITEDDIPNIVKAAANGIVHSLNKKNSLFALDFIVSDNGNVYLLEANVSPGIDWYDEFPQNKKMNQAMIDVIVKELSRRVLKRGRNEEGLKTYEVPLGRINSSVGINNFVNKIGIV